MRPWTALKMICKKITYSGFNGATALRPWTDRPAKKRAPVSPASMGPRPCGRGRAAPAAASPPSSGFNGATALRPWTAVQLAIGLTVGVGFNGATALRPWTVPTARAATTGRTSFNGATALRPWTAWPPASRLPRSFGASMGPRPCGRGRMSGAISGREARGQLQWGHGLAAVDGRRAQCHGQSGPRLQWGHGLAAVDGGAVRLHRVLEPQLQWGHGLAAVDGPPPPPARADSLLQASMGPRPCGRGRRAGRRHGDQGPRASMGPRPCGRGRAEESNPDLHDDELQWGHGLAAVDGVALPTPILV